MSAPNLLRPEQVKAQEMKAQRMEGMLSQPHVQDRGEIHRQLRGIKKNLEVGAPKEFKANEIDNAVNLSKALKEQILIGMPTQEEMRRAPPGAVSKHRAWEKRNKEAMLEWKYLQLRINAGTDDYDVANFEKYRPVGGAQQMNMDNSLVVKDHQYYIPNDAAHAVTMNEEQGEALKELDPELYSQMALLSAEKRAEILEVVNKVIDDPEKAVIARKPQTKRGFV